MIWRELKQKKQYERLMFKALRNEPYDGMEQLYKRYGKSIFTVAYQISNSKYIADGVVNDVLLRYQHAAVKRQIILKPSAWLCTVARNVTLDVIRKEEREHSEPLLFEPQAKENGVQEYIERQVFQWRLRHLSPKEKELVRRKVLDGDTFEEIGLEKGMKASTVSSMYYRSLRKLKSEYEKSDEFCVKT